MRVAGIASVSVPQGIVVRFSVALVLGIGSGAAMIPFSMIKEANPSQVKGTASGVMNFIVFLTTGIMFPFVLRLMVPTTSVTPTLHGFQDAFLPLVVDIAVAIVLSFIICETGVAGKRKDQLVGTPSEGACPIRSYPPSMELRIGSILKYERFRLEVRSFKKSNFDRWTTRRCSVGGGLKHNVKGE